MTLTYPRAVPKTNLPAPFHAIRTSLQLITGSRLQTKLIVDGFPSSFTDQDLKDLLAPFGSVISVSIARGPQGESLRMGQVEMALPEEAKKAKEKLHLSYVQGKMLLVFWETQETGK